VRPGADVGGGVRVRAISSTFPEGYHAPAGGQAGHHQVQNRGKLPSDRRVIGLRQVDEMALRGPGRLVRANSGSVHLEAAPNCVRRGVMRRVRGDMPRSTDSSGERCDALQRPAPGLVTPESTAFGRHVPTGCAAPGGRAAGSVGPHACRVRTVHAGGMASSGRAARAGRLHPRHEAITLGSTRVSVDTPAVRRVGVTPCSHRWFRHTSKFCGRS